MAAPRLAPALLAATVGAFGAFASGAARAQQLWSVEEAPRAPNRPAAVVNGAMVSPGAFGTGLPADVAEVRVAFDYLRLGFGRLELPLPDGSMIEADNAVFEDRGAGNLMWSGEVPGAGYESVLFTLQDGHLVGWFGEPGGPKYTIRAGADGRGTLALEAGPAGDWCGVGAGAGRGLARDSAAAATAERPASAASGSSDDRLDILLLYTTGTARFWRSIGGPAVGVRQLGDYLNMVFRNGEISAVASLIAVPWTPEIANPPYANGYHYYTAAGSRYSRSVIDWHDEFTFGREVGRLRERYKPDLVHFMTVIDQDGSTGAAELRTDLDPRVFFGFSTPNPSIFAHEIGHNLGGDHEPATFGDFAKAQSLAVRPYAFGHTDLTSCSGRGDVLSCPKTIMSYGQELWGDSERGSRTEPFYSSVRHKPNGWTIGVAGEREVERVFHETVPVAVGSGDYAEAALRREQFPRTVNARWLRPDRLRVTWSERWPLRVAEDLDGLALIHLALLEGANDTYLWYIDRESSALGHSANLRPVVEGGFLVAMDVAGLRPGGGYRVAVRVPRRLVDGDMVDGLHSDVFTVLPHKGAFGAPAPPGGVDVAVTGPDSARLTWRDNSSNESGFEVWYRKWSGAAPDEVWRLHDGPLAAGTRSVEIADLAADEKVEITPGHVSGGLWVPGEITNVGRYSFVVVAYNGKGFSASETFDWEFMPGPHPAPTAAGTMTDCVSRATGLRLDGYRVSACFETVDGTRRRTWDYGLDAERSGLLYFFDRDDAEILVKVVDGCAINGHRWVFVAPVTTLAFRLLILEGNFRWWWYDSERRSQDELSSGARTGNPQSREARTVSDTTAFPCAAAEIAASRAGGTATGSGAGATAFVDRRQAVEPVVSARSLSAGASTDCEPGGPAVTLQGGYKVGMCYEAQSGEAGDARDWGLDSSRMGLLYFSERDSVEALVKVVDGCASNGHRWVFVAPATLAAFNLYVEGPGGERWTHANRLGETAEARMDRMAFRCATGEDAAIGVDGAECGSELCRAVTGQAVRFTDLSAGSVESRRWSFGDGVESDLAEVAHSWSAPGFYEVTLRVSDGDRETIASRTFLVESSDPAGACASDPETLCLQDSRYEVRVDWSTAEGERGAGSVVHAGTNDSGLFWFFDRDNWEVLIKVLDGCAVNGHVWVYGASTTDLGYSIRVRDTVTGRTEVFRNEAGLAAPAITENEAFSAACRQGGSAATGSGDGAAGDPPGFVPAPFGLAGSDSRSGCAAGEASLCLADSRFEVAVDWSTADRRRGAAGTVPVGTNNSGLFYFFDPGNWEMLIKVLDGCAINGHHWVYAASATDQGFDITVTDTATGATWTHSRAPGPPASAVTDGEAFPDSCRSRGEAGSAAARAGGDSR